MKNNLKINNVIIISVCIFICIIVTILLLNLKKTNNTNLTNDSSYNENNNDMNIIDNTSSDKSNNELFDVNNLKTIELDLSKRYGLLTNNKQINNNLFYYLCEPLECKKIDVLNEGIKYYRFGNVIFINNNVYEKNSIVDVKLDCTGNGDTCGQLFYLTNDHKIYRLFTEVEEWDDLSYIEDVSTIKNKLEVDDAYSMELGLDTTDYDYALYEIKYKDSKGNEHLLSNGNIKNYSSLSDSECTIIITEDERKDLEYIKVDNKNLIIIEIVKSDENSIVIKDNNNNYYKIVVKVS